MTGTPSFGAELFHGRLRTDLLALPPGDPRGLGGRDAQFLDRLREFCEREVDGELIEREDRIPDAVIEGLKDIGAFCIKIPREYGGLGLSGRCYLRALMIANTAHAALGELLAAHQAIGLPQPVALFGTEEQKSLFLPRCVREISAFTLTEADIGNDPFRIRTTAVPDRASGTYTLNGVKLWVTNGVVADLLVVMAHVPGAEDAPGGMTAFVVEADAPGVTVEHRSSFLGLRGLENGVIRLHDVTVPALHRIGDEGAGLDVALAAQDTARLSLPAVCAAAAKWSLGVARQWSGVRVQWGRRIGEHDAVAGRLACVAATTFALEAMVGVSALHADLGTYDTRMEAELAKLFASEKTWLIADGLVQLRGGRGYETAASAAARGERGIPVERLLRDQRIGRIFDGSTEALRSFLADAILSGRKAKGPVDAAEPEVSGATGPLAAHLRFAARAAHRLDRQLDGYVGLSEEELCGQQRALGRIVDIGAELYAMAAACAYAAALSPYEGGDTGTTLADAFCAQASRRVDALFAELARNTDLPDCALAHQILDGRFRWLEEGVLDTSLDGPWIAEPKPGPSRVPNVRRRVPASGRTHPY